MDGLGIGESVGLAVLEDDRIAVPLGTAAGPNSATQAIRGSVRPEISNAFLIVAFAFNNKRIFLEA
jgi:hypothetical protein